MTTAATSPTSATILAHYEHQVAKREAARLKPSSTPILLKGDSSRGLEDVTYHPVHGRLQAAPSISLKNQKVLEEDEYMEALSNIIKRDFFPSLDQFEKDKERWIEERQRRSRLMGLTRQPTGSTKTDVQNNWPHKQPDLSQLGWEDGGPTPKLGQAATPGMTPLGVNQFSDTPASSTRGDPVDSTEYQTSRTKQKKPYDESLSLDEFCSRYTSQDNSSFSEILNNTNRLKRIKYSWAFESSSNHNAKLLESTLRRQHLIDTIGKMAEGGKGVGLIEGISGKPGERKMIENVVTRDERLGIESAQNQLLIEQGSSSPNPVGSQISELKGKSKAVTSIDLVTDSKAQEIRNPDSWPHVTRNALMFAPDANISSHEPGKPVPFPAAPPVLLGGPKSINHASTRMLKDDGFEMAMKQSKRAVQSVSSMSPTRSQIVAAINGTPNPQLSSTPTVNGFKLVPEMATPNLESESELDQLMTWGEIISTPLRVEDRTDEGGTTREEEIQEGPFRIAKRPKREELALNMARQASKSLREKYGSKIGAGGYLKSARKNMLGGKGISNLNQPSIGSLTPSRSSDREEMLSPAAKSLLKKAGSHHPSGNSSIRSVGARDGIFTPKRNQ